MINRDLIRIKVVQLAYAYIQNGEKDLTKADKELELSLSKAYQLYNNLLLLICAVTKMARKRYDIITNLSKRDGRKVSRGSFIKNKFALQLSENADLRRYVENYGDPWEQKAEFVKNLLLEMQEDEADKEFARKLLYVTLKNIRDYQQYIREACKKWDFARLATMDVVIMEVAIAEMLNFSEIPVPVTINEYVELANEYSTPKSGRFVNGILDAIAKEKNIKIKKFL